MCRPEVYRVKAAIYHSLLRIADGLEDTAKAHLQGSGGTTSTVDIFPSTPASESTATHERLEALRKCLDLFDAILVEESPPGLYHPASTISQATSPRPIKPVQLTTLSGERGNVEHMTCDFCGADIFQSFFECRACVAAQQPTTSGDGFIVCPGCYSEGRSCLCENMEAVQCRPFNQLMKDRERVAMLLGSYGHPKEQLPIPMLVPCPLPVFKNC